MLLRTSTVLTRPGGDKLLHRDEPSTERQGTALLVDACWTHTGSQLPGIRTLMKVKRSIVTM